MNNDPFSTHQPVLKKVLTIIDKSKPILELGCGYGSTSILHDFCTENKIELFTLDNNHDWIEKICNEYPKNDYHTYKTVNDWEQDLNQLVKNNYSLVFIDQAPWEARVISLELYKNISDYIILHDCDYFPVNNIFGKQISPIVSQNNTGERDYSDVIKFYLEYFPENFPSPTGPPTLLGSQFKEINFKI